MKRNWCMLISTGAEVIIVDDESTDKQKMIAKEAGL